MGESFEMKKTLAILISALMLCSMLPLGIVFAGNAAYSITEYGGTNAVTVDGRWTTATEWTDAPHTWMSGNTTNSGKFAYKMDFNTYQLSWCIEFLTDTTNNAGDYWKICLDDSNTGGALPQVGDYMIEITGHTTIKAYQGTGTGWAQLSSAAEITWSNTIATSMWSSTPHWILEVQDLKTDGLVQVPNAPPTGMGIMAFDASNNQYTSWAPNANVNSPDSWGLIGGYSMDAVPEGFTFATVMIASCVAVMVGFVVLRKRQKA
jgi:hypothetical protein